MTHEKRTSQMFRIIEEHSGKFISIFYEIENEKIKSRKSYCYEAVAINGDGAMYYEFSGTHNMEIGIREYLKKFLCKKKFILCETKDSFTDYKFITTKWLDIVNKKYKFKKYDLYSHDEKENIYKIEDSEFIFSDEFTKITNPDLYEKKLHIINIKNRIFDWKHTDLFISFN